MYRFYSKKYRKLISLAPTKRIAYIGKDKSYHFLCGQYKDDSIITYVSEDSFNRFPDLFTEEK